VTALPQELETRAQAGDVDAQRALSQACDAQGRHDQALNWLDRAARSGDVGSATFLGARLLTGYAAPLIPDRGLDLIAGAAARGGAEACEILAAYVAEGRIRPQSWTDALDLLQHAAELGEPRSRGQLALLTGDADAAAKIRSGEPGPDVWRRARRAIDVDAWLTPPAAKVLSPSPRIRTIEGFLPEAVCDWLMERARGKLRPARVYDDGSGGPRQADARNNSDCEFHPFESDVVMALVRARIGAAAGTTPAFMEGFALLHYEVGQRFVRHFDFLDPTQPGLAKVMAERGQRVATALVYLNDDFEGAETEFPILALKWKGRKGDAIFFWNVDDQGAGDRRTLHAGLSPTRGHKWLLSQFIRDKSQPYV
jgi:hypothetical protein